MLLENKQQHNGKQVKVHLQKKVRGQSQAALRDQLSSRRESNLEVVYCVFTLTFYEPVPQPSKQRERVVVFRHEVAEDHVPAESC